VLPGDDRVTVVSPAVPIEQPATAGGLSPTLSVLASQEQVTRAQRLLAAGKVTRAISLLEAHLRSQPDADIAATLSDMRTIQRAGKRLQHHPDDPRAHLDMGRALFAQEQGPLALDHLSTACQKRPAWLEAQLLRAYELHWEERWQEAEAAYQAVLAIDPVHAVARRGLLAVRVCQSPEALMPLHDAPPTGMSSFYLH
jgi:Flp pilus assembly protein TadD